MCFTDFLPLLKQMLGQGQGQSSRAHRQKIPSALKKQVFPELTPFIPLAPPLFYPSSHHISAGLIALLSALFAFTLAFPIGYTKHYSQSLLTPGQIIYSSAVQPLTPMADKLCHSTLSPPYLTSYHSHLQAHCSATLESLLTPKHGGQALACGAFALAPPSGPPVRHLRLTPSRQVIPVSPAHYEQP